MNQDHFLVCQNCGKGEESKKTSAKLTGFAVGNRATKCELCGKKARAKAVFTRTPWKMTRCYGIGNWIEVK